MGNDITMRYRHVTDGDRPTRGPAASRTAGVFEVTETFWIREHHPLAITITCSRSPATRLACVTRARWRPRRHDCPSVMRAVRSCARMTWARSLPARSRSSASRRLTSGRPIAMGTSSATTRPRLVPPGAQDEPPRCGLRIPDPTADGRLRPSMSLPARTAPQRGIMIAPGGPACPTSSD